MNAALRIVPTHTITETNLLIYTAATVVLEMLVYKMNSNGSQKEQEHPPWKKWLEAKIMATQREVSLLSEILEGVNIQKRLLNKFGKRSTTEALETAKQRLTALATCLKR